MAPIRRGDGTPLEIPGVSEVRAGDGRVFFDAIPDSVTNHWPMDEGSGSTLTDAVGDDDISLNHSDWDSSVGRGGAVTVWDGIDNEGEASINFTDTLSFWIWFNVSDGSSEAHMVDIGDGSDASLQFDIGVPDDNELRLFANDADGGDNAIVQTSVSEDTWYFGGVQVDVSEGEIVLHLATADDSDLTEVGSNNFDGLDPSNPDTLALGYWDREDIRHFDGKLDDFGLANDDIITESDLMDVFDSTKSTYAD